MSRVYFHSPTRTAELRGSDPSRSPTRPRVLRGVGVLPSLEEVLEEVVVLLPSTGDGAPMDYEDDDTAQSGTRLAAAAVFLDKEHPRAV